jgi:hypothetical protein
MSFFGAERAASRLEAEVSELSSVIDALSSNPSLTDSDDRSEEDGAIVLFKAVLQELPQADSFYVGYENDCWLQVRRLDVLDPVEREKLGAPQRCGHGCNEGYYGRRYGDPKREHLNSSPRFKTRDQRDLINTSIICARN